jgi:hypothetical protein
LNERAAAHLRAHELTGRRLLLDMADLEIGHVRSTGIESTAT